MRIAFVITSLGAGGAEKNLALLARHRLALGDEVSVLAFRAQAAGAYFNLPSAVRVDTLERHDEPGGRGRPLRRLLWLRRRLAALEPDVAVAFLGKNGVLTLLATTGLPVATVIAERNNPAAQPASPLWRIANAALGPRAAAIVVQTERARGALPRRLAAGATVIPNPSVLPEGARADPGAGGRIVAVGRLDRQKGFDMLLEAFARAGRERPQATLTIFGEGPERAALELRVRDLGLAGRARLPGTTARPGDWMAEADIFALSSRYEGFPNVLAEALTAGLPCIAFDCPWGPAELLEGGEAGMLVPQGDPAALAAGLAHLLDDAQMRAGLSVRGAASAGRFAPRLILARWDGVIAAAADAASSARPSFSRQH